jgi:hypothetical protein
LESLKQQGANTDYDDEAKKTLIRNMVSHEEELDDA